MVVLKCASRSLLSTGQLTINSSVEGGETTKPSAAWADSLFNHVTCEEYFRTAVCPSPLFLPVDIKHTGGLRANSQSHDTDSFDLKNREMAQQAKFRIHK